MPARRPSTTQELRCDRIRVSPAGALKVAHSGKRFISWAGNLSIREAFCLACGHARKESAQRRRENGDSHPCPAAVLHDSHFAVRRPPMRPIQNVRSPTSW